MSLQQAKRQIRINTPLGPDKLLIDNLQIHEELGRLFECRADLLSEDDALSLDDLLGKRVDIELDYIDGGIRFFNAYVTEFIQVGIIGKQIKTQCAEINRQKIGGESPLLGKD